jgi:hypothetical protein
MIRTFATLLTLICVLAACGTQEVKKAKSSPKPHSEENVEKPSTAEKKSEVQPQNCVKNLLGKSDRGFWAGVQAGYSAKQICGADRKTILDAVNQKAKI